MTPKIKLLRITTVPISLNILLRGQLSYIQDNGFEITTVSAYGPEIEEFTKREHVSHHVIPFTRKITPFQDLICLWRLILFIRREKFLIVHSHTPKAGLIGMLAAKICGVPFRFHTVAGMPLMECSGFKRKLLKWTESITYQSATRIYPNSIRLKEFIKQEINIADDKVHVIANGSSNGIDTHYFQPTEEVVHIGRDLLKQLAIEENDLVITFIGRIVGDKGINELVEAFVKINMNVERKTKLILVGPFEDDLDPVSQKTKVAIDTHPNIFTVGFQPDVRPYLHISDIFAFPSYREGFPNVILQACAMGVPCIASDINGCNEVISHELTGLLVPSKNVDGLFDALKRMIQDETLRNSFSEKARQHVLKNYEQRYVWEQIVSEYKNQMDV